MKSNYLTVRQLLLETDHLSFLQKGEVVTAGGEPLIPQLIIPPNAQSITIGRDGTVSVELEAGQGDVQVGQIQVSRFVNPSGLMPMGRNLLERDKCKR